MGRHIDYCMTSNAEGRMVDEEVDEDQEEKLPVSGPSKNSTIA